MCLLFIIMFSYQGHGFRKDLATMLANLKPQFLKFPGLTTLHFIFHLELSLTLYGSEICIKLA